MSGSLPIRETPPLASVDTQSTDSLKNRRPKQSKSGIIPKSYQRKWSFYFFPLCRDPKRELIFLRWWPTSARAYQTTLESGFRWFQVVSGGFRAFFVFDFVRGGGQNLAAHDCSLARWGRKAHLGLPDIMATRARGKDTSAASPHLFSSVKTPSAPRPPAALFSHSPPSIYMQLRTRKSGMPALVRPALQPPPPPPPPQVSTTQELGGTGRDLKSPEKSLPQRPIALSFLSVLVSHPRRPQGSRSIHAHRSVWHVVDTTERLLEHRHRAEALLLAPGRGDQLHADRCPQQDSRAAHALHKERNRRERARGWLSGGARAWARGSEEVGWTYAAPRSAAWPCARLPRRSDRPCRHTTAPTHAPS